MLTKVNGIPCLFTGYKGYESEIDSLLSLIESELQNARPAHEVWIGIAKILELNNIDNTIFIISIGGICFCRIK